MIQTELVRTYRKKNEAIINFFKVMQIEETLQKFCGKMNSWETLSVSGLMPQLHHFSDVIVLL